MLPKQLVLIMKILLLSICFILIHADDYPTHFGEENSDKEYHGKYDKEYSGEMQDDEEYSGEEYYGEEYHDAEYYGGYDEEYSGEVHDGIEYSGRVYDDEYVDPEFRKTPGLDIESSNYGDITVGSTWRFDCKIRGVHGQVWWTKDEKNLTSVDDSERSGILVIAWAMRKDNGNYTCVANTTDGIFLNRTIDIGVKEPAKITANPRNVRVNVNGSVILSCNVQGDALSDFTWDCKLSPFHGTHLTNLTTGTYRDKTYVTMTLSVTNVTNEYRYCECSANDSGKRISDNVTVQVIDIPRIEDCKAIAIGASSVFLSWLIQKNKNCVVNISIQYIKNGTEQWQDYAGAVKSRNYIGFIIKGLANDTVYQFRVVASNSIGDSLATGSNWVTTFKKDFDFIPTFLIERTTLHSITVRCFGLPVELQNDHVFDYTIMATSQENVIKEKSVFPPYLRVLDYLKPKTSYCIKIAACNRYTEQCSDWSSEQKVITKERYPKFVPTVLIKASTLDSITIGWSLPPPQLQYDVHQYKVMAIHYNEIRGPVYLPITTNSYVFENLSSRTVYQLKVAACNKNKMQCGEWSPKEEGFTIDGDPKFVPTVSIETTTLNSITIRWSLPPPQLQSEIHQYKVMAMHYNDTRGPVYENAIFNSHYFGFLSPRTSYRVKVAACGYHKTHCGNWSTEKECFTADWAVRDETQDTTRPIMIIIFVILIALTVTWFSIRNRRRLATRRRCVEVRQN